MTGHVHGLSRVNAKSVVRRVGHPRRAIGLLSTPGLSWAFGNPVAARWLLCGEAKRSRLRCSAGSRAHAGPWSRSCS